MFHFPEIGKIMTKLTKFQNVPNPMETSASKLEAAGWKMFT